MTVQEVASILREWIMMWKTLFVVGQIDFLVIILEFGHYAERLI